MKKQDSFFVPLIISLSIIVPIVVALLMIFPDVFHIESESIDFSSLNGGSGWTRTTDLTLIKSDPHGLRGKDR